MQPMGLEFTYWLFFPEILISRNLSKQLTSGRKCGNSSISQNICSSPD